MERKVNLTMPPTVVGPVDIGRLSRELGSINEVMMQLELRKSGTEVKLPKTSSTMDLMLAHNQLNLLRESDRKVLGKYLDIVKEHAPVVHMSFSADPTSVFLDKLMTWLRTEINPHLLLTVGLQPNIGAGCVVRTTNKYFDFSLKEAFNNKRNLLIDKIVTDTFNNATTPNSPSGA